MKITSDFKELKAWEKDLKAVTKATAQREISTEILKEIAKTFLDIVTAKTPVGVVSYKIHPQHDRWVNDNPGELRDAWREDNKNLKVTRAGTGSYRLVLVNKTKYAKYVNYGHMQHIGQYVWWIEGRLKRPYIKPTYFLELSELEVRDEGEEIARRKIEEWLIRRIAR